MPTRDAPAAARERMPSACERMSGDSYFCIYPGVCAQDWIASSPADAAEKCAAFVESRGYPFASTSAVMVVGPDHVTRKP